jgi:hypothetical protein
MHFHTNALFAAFKLGRRDGVPSRTRARTSHHAQIENPARGIFCGEQVNVCPSIAARFSFFKELPWRIFCRLSYDCA